MEGYIKIQVIDDNDERTNIAVATEMKGVGKAEKVLLLSAFMQSIDISEEEAVLALALISTKLKSKTIKL